MPSTVEKLPTDMKIELKRRLRTGMYDYLGISNWLKEEGFNISKSAVGRYGKRLKVSDEKLGLDREIMVKAGMDLAALFEELAQLKSREAEILAQIKAATILKPSVQNDLSL